jgi:KUP system potassium uptake protein
VLPCLLLNYWGQGALVIANPKAAENPFFLLGPSWALYPMVGIATVAAIIASQALISGAFSLTRQAMQLGYVPRLQIVHTSSHEIGQIYMPAVNWFLLVGVIALVLGFKNSSNLAAAYGIAVTTTMVITSILAFMVAKDRWGWHPLAAGALFGVFLIVDLAFFATNVVKIVDGGWFPLLLAAGIFLLMTTWRRGRGILYQRLTDGFLPLAKFFERIKAEKTHRVPGTAVFMTSNLDVTPPSLLHNVEHNKVVHERVVFLTVVNEDFPTVGPRGASRSSRSSRASTRSPLTTGSWRPPTSTTSWPAAGTTSCRSRWRRPPSSSAARC